jgi:hypothetical protein
MDLKVILSLSRFVIPKLYEEEPSTILYKQHQPKTAFSYKTFGDEAWTQQLLFYKGKVFFHSNKLILRGATVGGLRLPKVLKNMI